VRGKGVSHGLLQILFRYRYGSHPLSQNPSNPLSDLFWPEEEDGSLLHLPHTQGMNVPMAKRAEDEDMRLEILRGCTIGGRGTFDEMGLEDGMRDLVTADLASETQLQFDPPLLQLARTEFHGHWGHNL
jgi:hypothetical protein